MSLKDNVTRLEAEREPLKTSCKSFEAQIENDLTFARQHKMDADHISALEKRLASTRKSTTETMQSHEAKIQQAKKALAEEEKAQLAEIEANAEKVKEQIKGELYTAWISAGGTPADFETAFPDLYKAEITKRTLAKAEANKRQFAANVKGMT